MKESSRITELPFKVFWAFWVPWNFSCVLVAAILSTTGKARRKSTDWNTALQIFVRHPVASRGAAGLLSPLDYVKSRVQICPKLKEAMVYCLWYIKFLTTYVPRIEFTFSEATLTPLSCTSPSLPTGSGSGYTIADTSWQVNGTFARMSALRSQLMRAIAKMQSAETGWKRNFIFMMLYLHTFKSTIYRWLWMWSCY